jgi:hypothetical protein
MASLPLDHLPWPPAHILLHPSSSLKCPHLLIYLLWAAYVWASIPRGPGLEAASSTACSVLGSSATQLHILGLDPTPLLPCWVACPLHGLVGGKNTPPTAVRGNFIYLCEFWHQGGLDNKSGLYPSIQQTLLSSCCGALATVPAPRTTEVSET